MDVIFTVSLSLIHILVKDHMCIFLDASSTAYTLGMKLTGFTELTVITNGIDLALALKDIPGITVILTGGIVTSASSSIEGLLGVDLLPVSYTHLDVSKRQSVSCLHRIVYVWLRSLLTFLSTNYTVFKSLLSTQRHVLSNIL